MYRNTCNADDRYYSLVSKYHALFNEEEEIKEYPFNKMAEAVPLSLKTAVLGKIGYPCAEVWYKFIADDDIIHSNDSNRTYIIGTSGLLDTEGCLFDSNGLKVALIENGMVDNNFRIVCNLEYGKTYYLRVKAYCYHTGFYKVWVDYR